jgi:hypothetical protein
MHAEHPLGMPCACGNLMNRNGGGVGGEYGFRPYFCFYLGQNLPLYVELLEYRFDNQVGPAESAVIDRAG